MTPGEIEALIADGSGQEIELLPEPVSARALAAQLVALANADGGTVIIGAAGLKSSERAHDAAMRAYMLCSPPMMLPLPERAEVDSKPCLLIHVPKGLPHVYNLRGKYLVRDGTRNTPLGTRRLRQLLLERGETGYESQMVAGATRDDLDERRVRAYAGAVEALASLPVDDVLLRRGCARRDGGELKPTVAGLLMFGRDPTRHLNQCGILLARYDGQAMADAFEKEEVRDTLPEQIRRAEGFVVARMRRGARLSGLAREERLEYPRAAVRELIVNAVAHRDYSIRGDEIRIALYSDRLEVYSPGRLPGHVTLKNMVDERFSRNDVIVQLLADLGFIERLGYGIDRILRLAKEHGLSRPRFAETANGFKVTLYGPGDDFRAEVPDAARWQKYALNDRQMQAVRWLQANGRITNRDYHELVPDVSEETIRRDLAEMVDKNVLLKIGDKRATYYILK
ncbi:MAG: DeoR family transcriptional regulator [Chloroflexi bacterium]|nr:DeoR family transcriptional regulator [Chloroflexota bacterium]